MTRKKVALIIGLVAVAGLIAGRLAYAQGDSDSALNGQEPATTEPTFSFFFDGGTFLGIYAEEITKENMGRYSLREVRGVGVAQVVKDSPAEKAGLKKDDVILRFDGESVTSVRKLNRLVSEVSPDQTVRLTISRGGAEQEVTVTLSKRSELGRTIHDDVLRGLERDFPKIDPGDFVFSFGNNRRIGVSTQQLTKQLAEYFGAKEGGVLITSVSDNSPAARAGLKAGDVITAVDSEKVTSAGDLSRAINKKQDGTVTLTIIRDHSTSNITVTPEKPAQVTRPGAMTTRRIVLPRILLPEIPEMNIQIPRIVLPAIPEINVTVPSKPRAPGKAPQIII